MKETYFTDSNIQEKTRRILQQLRAERPQPKLTFKSAEAALLILDMQDYFLKETSRAFVPAAAAIVPGIKRLIGAFARRRRPVFLTRHINTDENAKLMARWWRQVIRRDDPLSRISEELDVSAGTIVEKSQYDAFYETSFENVLKQNRVTQLVIAGVMTNLCCETTARSAFVRGFDVFFLVDGTAAYNEHYHMATLTNLSFGVAEVMSVSEILAAMEQNNAS